MRSPEKVLNSLTEHSKDTSYKYERLYRILFNEGMYYVAYQRIYAKEGNMTPGSDNQTIDGMSLTRIAKLIASLKDESYQPQPSRRVYIKVVLNIPHMAFVQIVAATLHSLKFRNHS